MNILLGVIIVLAAYFLIGYVVSTLSILAHKRGSKIVDSALMGGDDYSLMVSLWPIWLITLIIESVTSFDPGESRWPLSPEAVAEKIANHNKMHTIIEGKESQDEDYRRR